MSVPSCQYNSSETGLQNGTAGSNTCDTSACTYADCIGIAQFNATSENTVNFVQWSVGILKTNQNDPVQNLAFIHINDQATFKWTMANWPGPSAISHALNPGQNGEQFNSFFTNRIAQGGFGVWRFINWMYTSGALPNVCSMWFERKPTSYAFYSGNEMRASLFVGTATYTDTTIASFTGTLSGTSLTVSSITGTIAIGQSIFWSGGPTGSGVPFITAGSGSSWTVKNPTGTSVGPVAMTTNSNDYALASLPGTYSFPGYTPGGAPVRNQVVIVYWPNTATSGNITFDLDGYGVQPVYDQGGSSLTNSGYNQQQTSYFPTASKYGALIYDPDLNGGNGGWMSFSGGSYTGNYYGLNCGVPPEIDLQLAVEIGAHPWFDAFTFSLVPPTDYVPSLATYVKANQPSWMIPRFSINEPFNNSGYGNNKAQIYWSVANDYQDWFGMAASLMCQNLYSVYGAKDGSKYECMTEPQSSQGNSVSNQNALQTANNFVTNCTGTCASAATGFSQDPAYKWLTAIAINNYWSPRESGTAQELTDAYNYSIGSSGQQATILASYVGTGNEPQPQGAPFGIYIYNEYYTNFDPWSIYCTGTNVGNAPAGCNIKNMYMYEGGYSTALSSINETIAVTGATAANPAVLSIGATKTITAATAAASAVLTIGSTNGLVIGSTVGIESASGGTWSSVDDNSYTVTAINSTGTTITINLNSSGLGTFSSGTLSYNGAVVGMPVTISGVVGITGLNSPAADTVTGSSGGNTITTTSNTFVAGQAVIFSASFGSIVKNTTYCVLSGVTSTAVQVVTTANCGGSGSALTGITGGSGTAQEAWFVSAVTPSKASLSSTASLSGSYSSGGTLNYYGSLAYLDALQLASYAAPEVGTLTLTNYANILAAGGKFPSMYYFTGFATYTWQVLAPDIYAGGTQASPGAGPPQLQAIGQFNGKTTCPSC